MKRKSKILLDGVIIYIALAISIFFIDDHSPWKTIATSGMYAIGMLNGIFWGFTLATEETEEELIAEYMRREESRRKAIAKLDAIDKENEEFWDEMEKKYEERDKHNA